MKISGLTGSYGKAGINRFELDLNTGLMSGPVSYFAATDAKAVSVYKGFAAFPSLKEQAGISLIELNLEYGQYASSFYSEKTTACYVIQDDDYIYASYFHEGQILIYSKQSHIVKLQQCITVGEEAGCHQVLFHENLMLVPCLKLNKILIFDRTSFDKITEIQLKDKSGPRHAMFNREHSRFYVICEYSCEVAVYQVTGSEFHIMQVASLLDKHPDGSLAAAIRLSPDGRFLYCTVRGADLIIVFEINDEGQLKKIQMHPSTGQEPWDVILSPDGAYLITANRKSDNCISYKRDIETGRIDKEALSVIEIGQAAALAWKES